MTGEGIGQPEESRRGPTGFDDYELKLGDIIRGERATLGKSLLDVQRDIKIKASYLAAIEDADLDAFETPGFIAGYIRAYARYLGLNPDWAYRSFCKESGYSHVEGLHAQIHSKKPKPAGKPSNPQRLSGGDDLFARSPIYAAPRESLLAGIRPGMIGSFAVLFCLIVGLGYGGWSVLREIQKVSIAPVESALGAVPPAAAETDGPVSGDAAAASAAADRIDRLYRPQALDAPVLVARDGPISSLDPREQGAYASTSSLSSLAPVAVAPPVAESLLAALEPESVPDAERSEGENPVALPGEVQVTAQTPPEVVIFAREPVWVRVRSADGTVILEKILDGGERFVLPQTEEPSTLRAGNSGSLYFAVNGETFGPAGQGTSIARNVSLGAEELVAVYEPVDLDADPELKQLAALMIVPVSPETE